MNINDKMWNGGYPMMSYTVVAEIKREKNMQYELKCENCSHSGEPCRILITKDDNKNYSYVGMVNECVDDEIDRHYYFHKNNGYFHLSKEAAEIEKVEKSIIDCRNEIENHKKGIIYQEGRLKEYQDRLAAYKEILSANSLSDNSSKS